MGTTGKVLLNFYRKMADTAHKVTRDIVTHLEAVFDLEDNPLIAEESKRESQ